MWNNLERFILQFRLPLILLIAGITVFMGFQARKVELSFEFNKTVPANDPDMIFFQKFRAEYGEDGNIVALGLKDSAIYKIESFRELRKLSVRLRSIEYVTEVISLPLIKRIEKDTAATQFRLANVFPDEVNSQEELDSLLTEAFNQRFYAGQIVNEENGALAIFVALDKAVVNSPKRVDLTDAIIAAGEEFTSQTGIELHYAGLPFVRSVIATQVNRELKAFLWISILVTGIILLIFFRSWRAVIFPMIVIGIIVVWVLGSIVLFGFKITLLTGLIPPIIVVIGIPNAIYLTNKFHTEYAAHGDKARAIREVVHKIGLATFITNLTTAIGFLVLITARIEILKEFGIIAGINVMATFVVSIILIPTVFSWMPAPSTRHLKHLQISFVKQWLTAVDTFIHRRRSLIYIATGVIVGLALFGISRINSLSFIVDDLPEESTIKKDLEFFEANFSGVMPLEIIIDTGSKRGIMQVRNLQRINEFEDFLESQEDISKPVSIISFVKAAKQAFYNGNPNRYSLPDNRERAFILPYMRGQTDNSGLFNSFVDSTLQKMRISLQVADVGSQKMDSLIHEVILPKADSLFSESDIEMHITGSTPLFVKGNKFLVSNLKMSLLLAFVLIALTMGILFSNIRMVLISLIPNFIPMMITAGLMGYFGIPLKPSTVLIFSIAFGISVDYSIHFLAKYRQELYTKNFYVPVAVSATIMEVGKSMLYTSIVLFAGFIIFAFSSFGGTIALGWLTSVTLLLAAGTNLILLPALIISFDPSRFSGKHPLIEQFEPEVFNEDEAEDNIGDSKKDDAESSTAT